MRASNVDEVGAGGGCIDPFEVLTDLAILIVEGRTPGGDRGFHAGPHCPSIQPPSSNRHVCDNDSAVCIRFESVLRHLRLMWGVGVGVTIEVLVAPDCEHRYSPQGQCANSLLDTTSAPSSHRRLLEQWNFTIMDRKHPEATSNGRSLIAAVRSFLHFSQLSAWFSKSQGQKPPNIKYRLNVTSDVFCSKFVDGEPQEHAFPVALVGQKTSIKVLVRTLPRSNIMPSVVCFEHAQCQNPVVSPSDSSSSSSCSLPQNSPMEVEHESSNDESASNGVKTDIKSPASDLRRSLMKARLFEPTPTSPVPHSSRSESPSSDIQLGESLLDPPNSLHRFPRRFQSPSRAGSPSMETPEHIICRARTPGPSHGRPPDFGRGSSGIDFRLPGEVYCDKRNNMVDYGAAGSSKNLTPVVIPARHPVIRQNLHPLSWTQARYPSVQYAGSHMQAPFVAVHPTNTHAVQQSHQQILTSHGYPAPLPVFQPVVSQNISQLYQSPVRESYQPMMFPTSPLGHSDPLAMGYCDPPGHSDTRDTKGTKYSPNHHFGSTLPTHGEVETYKYGLPQYKYPHTLFEKQLQTDDSVGEGHENLDCHNDPLPMAQQLEETYATSSQFSKLPTLDRQFGASLSPSHTDTHFSNSSSSFVSTNFRSPHPTSIAGSFNSASEDVNSSSRSDTDSPVQADFLDSGLPVTLKRLSPSRCGYSPSRTGLSPLRIGLSPSGGGVTTTNKLSSLNGSSSLERRGLSPSRHEFSSQDEGFSPARIGISPSRYGLSPSERFSPSLAGLSPHKPSSDIFEETFSANSISDCIVNKCLNEGCTMDRCLRDKRATSLDANFRVGERIHSSAIKIREGQGTKRKSTHSEHPSNKRDSPPHEFYTNERETDKIEEEERGDQRRFQPLGLSNRRKSLKEDVIDEEMWSFCTQKGKHFCNTAGHLDEFEELKSSKRLYDENMANIGKNSLCSNLDISGSKLNFELTPKETQEILTVLRQTTPVPPLRMDQHTHAPESQASTSFTHIVVNSKLGAAFTDTVDKAGCKICSTSGSKIGHNCEKYGSKSGNMCHSCQKSGNVCHSSQKSGNVCHGCQKSGNVCHSCQKSGKVCHSCQKSGSYSISTGKICSDRSCKQSGKWHGENDKWCCHASQMALTDSTSSNENCDITFKCSSNRISNNLDEEMKLSDDESIEDGLTREEIENIRKREEQEAKEKEGGDYTKSRPERKFESAKQSNESSYRRINSVVSSIRRVSLDCPEREVENYGESSARRNLKFESGETGLERKAEGGLYNIEGSSGLEASESDGSSTLRKVLMKRCLKAYESVAQPSPNGESERSYQNVHKDESIKKDREMTAHCSSSGIKDYLKEKVELFKESSEYLKLKSNNHTKVSSENEKWEKSFEGDQGTDEENNHMVTEEGSKCGIERKSRPSTLQINTSIESNNYSYLCQSSLDSQSSLASSISIDDLEYNYRDESSRFISEDDEEVSNICSEERKITPRVTIPSTSDKVEFRRSLDSAATLVFHNKTGLPLTSSPAPLRKGKRFDYDSSLTCVAALKSAFRAFKSNVDTDSESEDNTSPIIQTSNKSELKFVLSASAPATVACSNLLGTFEECVLNGRLEPVSTVHGFTCEIAASGAFCPKHIFKPVTVFFYTLCDNDQISSPYMGHINLGKKGYHIPKQGTVQVTLFNPHSTVVKMFVVVYDLSDMPPNSRTFLRQRTLNMPVNSSGSHPDSHQWLRYLIHLRFASSKSGKIYLHTDIRMLIFRKSDADAAALHKTNTPYELRSFTDGPQNPKFSPRK